MAKRARPKGGRADRKTRRPDRLPLRPAAATPVAIARPEPPPPPRPPDDAIRLFQAGMEALQRHVYAQAAEQFQGLVDRYPAERALLERARVYLELCQRELRRQPSEPRTVEDRLTHATAALNDGDDAKAERLARLVLAEDPRQDMALYLLSAVEARRGATDAALAYLGQTIAISPEARAQVRHDADFESLRGLAAFQELTEPPAPPPGLRRPRRGRGER